MKIIASCAAIVAAFFLTGVLSAAPDFAREKHFAEELTSSAATDEVVALETGAGRRFLGLLKLAAKPRAALLLVHRAGVNPDFGLVGKLRLNLAERGYTTLSIQMPVLAPDAVAQEYVALFPEAGLRLEAAMVYLRARGINRIVLISHGMGARMANDFIVGHPNARLTAWVSLSISSGSLKSLARVRFPVLDVYAEHDLDVVRRGAAGRAEALRSHHGSKQAMVFGANHAFAGKEKEVAALIDQLLTPLVK